MAGGIISTQGTSMQPTPKESGNLVGVRLVVAVVAGFAILKALGPTLGEMFVSEDCKQARRHVEEVMKKRDRDAAGVTSVKDISNPWEVEQKTQWGSDSEDLDQAMHDRDAVCR